MVSNMHAPVRCQNTHSMSSHCPSWSLTNTCCFVPLIDILLDYYLPCKIDTISEGETRIIMMTGKKKLLVPYLASSPKI